MRSVDGSVTVMTAPRPTLRISSICYNRRRCRRTTRCARVAEVLGWMTSAKQAAEQLLHEALDGRGSDNVTIIIGRTTPKPLE